MEEDNSREITAWEYRKMVRSTFSVLGGGLAVMMILMFAVELLQEVVMLQLSQDSAGEFGRVLYGLLRSEWFSVAGSSLLSYCIVLPVVFAVFNRVPDVVPEKKRMRICKFLMFFVLAQGLGYVLNFAGNIINIIVALLTERNAANMNPVNNLFRELHWLTILYVSVLGPIIEEYIFRWKLLNRLRPFGEKAAIVFSAVMFGLFHGNLSQMLYATEIGLVLGYVAVKTGRMKYNCLLHIMINSVSTVLALCMARGGLYLAAAERILPYIVLGTIIGAIVILFVQGKRVWLVDGDWPEGVRYRDFSSAMFFNAGVLVFAGLSLMMVGFYLFAV